MMLSLLMLAIQATPPADPRLETLRSDVVCRAGSISGSTERHEGTITGTGSCEYPVRLRRGQSLRATLEADPGINVAIVAPRRHDFNDGARFVAPSTGTYTVRVSQSRLFQRANEPARSFKLRLTFR